MAYNTSPTKHKQTCTDYVEFGKCQDRFVRFSWTKNDSNYLDIIVEMFKRECKNAELRLRQNFTMAEAGFNRFIRQRNQLVVAADILRREQNLSPVLQYTLSKDMEEQLKLVHKVIDLVGRPNRRICVTLLRYMRTTQIPPMLRVVYSDERRRNKNFSKLCMSTINLTNLYIFLTSCFRCMIKYFPTNPSGTIYRKYLQ